QIAERIRQRINDKEILVTKSTTLRISASMGISSAEEYGDYDFGIKKSSKAQPTIPILMKLINNFALSVYFTGRPTLFNKAGIKHI
ncbi:hypothetical protein MJM99_29660, partial [Salmonella enterica subsp. enterica serovar Kentucky]|nr:hypothetical protein [Salmonella enterica subsp. enterica serovar Kentucky]